MKNSITQDENSIKQDIEYFLQTTPSVKAFTLCQAAGVSPSVVSRLLRNKIRDTRSRNADKLRAAMRRFEAESSPTIAPETPTERGEVKNGND